MAEISIARRYADGVFRLAREENRLDAWRADLARLEALLSDEVLRAAFANPAVTHSRRLELARHLDPDLSPGARNLLRLLIERQRTRLVAEIRREFERLADEAAGVLNVSVTTAVELDAKQRENYERTLGKRLNRQVRVQYGVQPALVGGATVQIGDRLVDGSIRTQLARLRQELAG